HFPKRRVAPRWDETTQPYLTSSQPPPDGGESQALGLALVSVAVMARAWERWEHSSPQKCSTYSAPSGVKAASSGISLQHTQQAVLGSLTFMVVFLHWLTKLAKVAAGIGLANRKPCTVSQPACRNHARLSGVSTP